MSKSGYAHLYFEPATICSHRSKIACLLVTVAPECVSKYNELKLGKSIKYIIYKLSDDYKEIVVEDTSSDPDWEAFQNKLLNAKAGHKGKEGKGPRYAVYDFQYELEGGEGTRNKIVFISWSPDEGTLVFPRMTYASSKESLKNALPGLAAEVQANRDDEIEYETILKDISKGKR
ncbi:cofilin [Puttea exsequens]|nr:cofilin [Puttea exsequens]